MKLKKFNFTYSLGVGLMIGAMICFTPATSIANPNKELQEVQKEIENHQKLIKQKQNDLNELQKQLDQDEQEFMLINRQLKRSQLKLDSSNAKIKKIEKDQQQLLQQKNEHLSLLKTQLVEAYKLGSNDYIKLVLNQKNPNDIGRILEYYKYISLSRFQIIKSIDELTEKIKKNHQDLVKNNKELQKDIQDHNQNKKKFAIKKQQKEETLQAINKSIKKEEKTLVDLKKAEQKILKAIAENQRILEEKRKKSEEEEMRKAKEQAQRQGKSQDQAVHEVQEKQARAKLQGFEKLKGSLHWPANGKLLKKYGDSRAGELKWDGLLIKASNQQVKAIANGDIVLATELSGYGLIIAIDHGDGYISLYANNRDNLKKVGDRVKAGELIAYTDHKSYQLDGALYFEIRHKGVTVNPSKWLRKQK